MRIEKNELIAVITGASSGIGKAVAMALSENGYHVVLIARDKIKLNRVQDNIKANGNKASMYSLDVSSHQAIKTCVNDIILKHKKIDVLFNNAGIAGIGTSEIKLSLLENLMKINLLGAIYLANAVSTHMKDRNNGYIFNLSSIAGYAKGAIFNLGGYAASKFGLVGYSNALYEELLAHHVKVTVLSPSIVNTPILKDEKKFFPVEKFIQPEDIAKIVLDLLNYDWRVSIRELIIECPIQKKVYQRFEKLYKQGKKLSESMRIKNNITC